MRRALVACWLLLAVGLGTGTSVGASSTVVVTATIPSATSLSATACPAGTSNVTNLGTVLPGATSVATGCQLTWGSTNSTPQLRAVQADGGGSAMYRDTNGTPDAGFDSDGIVTIDTATGGGDDSGGVVVQPDGRLVTFFQAQGAASWALRRYNVNGTQDMTFGGDGQGEMPGANAIPRRLIEAPGGGFYATGYVNAIAYLAKWTAAGVPDPSFGTGGLVTLPNMGGTNFEWGQGVTVQADGKVVVVGYVDPVSVGVQRNFIARFNTNGSPDTDFGGGDGWQYYTIGTRSISRDVAVQPDGKIVAMAPCNPAATGQDVCILRVLPDGTPDTTFGGGDGWATHTVVAANATEESRSVHVMDDGTIVTVGRYWDGTDYDAFVMRLEADGDLDPTWNGTGIRTIAVTADDDLIGGARIDDAGRFILSSTRDLPEQETQVIRLLQDGTLDPSWGTGGVRQVNLGTGNETVFWIDIGYDGTIGILGHTDGTADDDVFAMRWTGIPVPDYGTGTWAGGGGVFGACLVSAGAGATAAWTPNATCAPADGAIWNGVPSAASSLVASRATSGTSTSTVAFGFKAGTTQAPGSYIAPVRFDVVAP